MEKAACTEGPVQVTEGNVAEKVIDIIIREQHLEAGQVKLDSSFAELGIDSLDAVNILFALESEFSIDIPDAVAQSMKSVRQVVDSLTRVLEGKDVSDLVAMAKASAPAAS
jgi:acyl carrier protein